MKLAFREVVRRPSRFITATVILTLIAVLLMFLGGLLDGLLGDSTGALRAQRADLVVFSSTAKDSFLRSRVDASIRSAVSAVPGVTKVGGIGVSQLGGRVPGNGPRDLVDLAVFGYEIPPAGVPSTPLADGTAYVDEKAKDKGVRSGMSVLVGPARTPITVVGFVTDTNYEGQASMWVSAATWRAVQSANRPAEHLADGVFQAFVVQADKPQQVAAAIDRATAGATSTLTTTAAANALPGVSQQQATFNQIIGVTVVIAVVVVALFFALLTVERTALYGVLKAVGARSRTLFLGLVTQATLVTIVASLIAAGLAVVISAVIPPGSIPFAISLTRVLESVAFMLVAAFIGCGFSFRRIIRIDPASAIGSAS
jgi:putative ABC transport system permease protein